MSSNTPSALANKHALLTGAAGGIGLAVATAYLQAGARCSVADIGEQPTPALAALVASHPDTLHYIRTDVTQMTQIDSLITQAQTRFGPITTLFNNAALFDMAPLLESDEVMFDKMFAVNVKGAFFVMQKVLAQMVAHQVQGGAVVNMASQAGRRGEAVISSTQSAALAMAPHQIRVNGIAPGVIDTPMWKNVDALFAKYENLSLGEKKKQVGAAVPLGYMGDPSDICGAAVFLASAASSYITAQTLNVDGGSVMS
jgi:D-sorbitol dehydrogenase (acceptor)